MFETILLTIDAGVATITLNRPEKLNAFAGDMRERLIEALDRVADSHEARVLVITGAGRAFCSGGDVAHMHALQQRQAPFAELSPLLEAGRAIVTRIDALPIPVIAAVNGVAAGAGMNLALACDVRLASSDAKFGETFVRIGLHADWGGTWALPRLSGLASAYDLCWSGDVIDAAEALRRGIVQRLWSAEEFPDAWRGYAARLAAAPSTSVRAAKQSLRAALHGTLDGALATETAAQEACWRSSDVAEGLAAFIEKRAPHFNGAPVAADAAPSAASRRFE